MSESVELRPYRAADLGALMELRRRCFPAHQEERELLRWAWQFEFNPARTRDWVPAWLAWHEGALVGAIGCVPCRVRIGGEDRTCASATDFMVDPAARALGTGLLLARRFLEPSSGPFPFATAPLIASLPLWRMCGAEVLPGTSEPMLWVAVSEVEPREPPTGRRVEAALRFDDEATELFERLAPRWRTITRRDAAYLDWRYTQSPFGGCDLGLARGDDGGLRGYAVVQRDESLGRAYLAELFADPDDDDTHDALIAFALERRRSHGLGELYALHREPAAQARLQAAGFHRVDQHSLGFFGRPPAGSSGLEGWYLTGGDGDLLFS